MSKHRMTVRAAFEKMAAMVVRDEPKEKILSFAREFLDLPDDTRHVDVNEDFNGLPVLWPDEGDRMHIGIQVLDASGELHEFMVEEFQDAIEQFVSRTIEPSDVVAEDVRWCLVLDSRERVLNQAVDEVEDPFKWS